MKSKLFFVIFGVLFFLSACGNPDPYSVNYFTGTKGVMIEFMKDAPPELVLEQSEFPVSIVISNQGAFSLNGSPYNASLDWYFDSFYLEIAQNQPEQWKNVSLQGKSYVYPLGERAYHYLPSLRSKKIPGQRESPSTKLSVSVCYPYKTTLADNICIDTYGSTDARTKVCKREDKSYSGQGAPVAITRLHFESQQQGKFARPIIFVEIQNVGSGTILTPIPSDSLNSCGIQAQNKSNWNTVRISAKLSNEELKCEPSIIRLTGDRGITRCYMENAGIGVNQNYAANLFMELDYVYLSTLSKEINIERTNINLDPITSGTCTNSWQVNIGGVCVDSCEACAKRFMNCGFVFTTSSWSCIAGDINQGTQINFSNKSQVVILHSDCIHEEGYCGPGSVCCSKCSKIQKCNTYTSKDSCEENACDLEPECGWTGSGCRVCNTDINSCNSYSKKEECKANFCDLEPKCDWSGSSCKACNLDIKSCNFYVKKEECEADFCGLTPVCEWNATVSPSCRNKS